MKGIQESGIAPAAKHFPGDGVDERDQHLSFAPNNLSCEEWDATFGKVYQRLNRCWSTIYHGRSHSSASLL